MRGQGNGGVDGTSTSYTVDIQAGDGFLGVIEGGDLVAFEDEAEAVAYAAAVAKRWGRATRVWRRHEKELGHDLDLVREVRPAHGPRLPAA